MRRGWKTIVPYVRCWSKSLVFTDFIDRRIQLLLIERALGFG
jgi:hypothetical protein